MFSAATKAVGYSSATPSVTLVATANSTTAGSTFTFTGVNLGTATADRTIVVGAMGNGASARSFSSITLAGSTMTLDVSTTSASNAGLAHLASSSGTSATIVVTFSGLMNGCYLVVYSIINKGTISTSNTNSSTATTTTVSTTLNTVTNGESFMIANRFNTTAPTISSTAGTTTQDVNTAFAITQRIYAGHTYPTSSGTGTTYSITYSGGSTTSLVVASYN